MQPMVRERNHELIWRHRNEEACMMEQKSHSRRFGSMLIAMMLIAMILLGGVPPVLAQTQSPPAPGQATTPPAVPAAGQAPPLPAVPDQRLEVYGYVMADF